jgi:hypothetical protein
MVQAERRALRQAGRPAVWVRPAWAQGQVQAGQGERERAPAKRTHHVAPGGRVGVHKVDGRQQQLLLQVRALPDLLLRLAGLRSGIRGQERQGSARSDHVLCVRVMGGNWLSLKGGTHWLMLGRSGLPLPSAQWLPMAGGVPVWMTPSWPGGSRCG